MAKAKNTEETNVATLGADQSQNQANLPLQATEPRPTHMGESELATKQVEEAQKLKAEELDGE